MISTIHDVYYIWYLLYMISTIHDVYYTWCPLYMISTTMMFYGSWCHYTAMSTIYDIYYTWLLCDIYYVWCLLHTRSYHTRCPLYITPYLIHTMSIMHDVHHDIHYTQSPTIYDVLLYMMYNMSRCLP
jgi:hypothetical protein